MIEGIGEQIKNNIPERLEEYIENLDSLDYKKIDAHYMYSFLRGVQEAVKKDKKVSDWTNLIDLLTNLINEDYSVEKKRISEFYDAWIIGSQAIHPAISDVLQELLTERNGNAVINLAEYRKNILYIISSLLENRDPATEDEKLESAKSTTTDGDNNEKIVSDPYSIAINSVRGRAFQCLLFFIYQDGKELEDKDVKIKDDVKEIYENVLEQEKTRAIMFLFGHHFPSFYFRDKNWMLGLFDKIFPKSDEKKYLYLATLEGYLTQTLYKEVFMEDKIQKLYLQAIELEDARYPHQKNFKNPYKALGEHLALAFVHFKPFDFENELFKTFWAKANIVSQKEFISFVGKSTLSRSNTKEIIEAQQIDINKIKDLWDWILDNINEPEVLAGFGMWLNTEKNVFDDKYLAEMMSKTLSKSDGAIEWDHALKEKLISFAEADIDATFSIIKHYLLNKDGEMNKHGRNDLYGIDKNIKPALDIIYKNGNESMKKDVRNLIDTLFLTKDGQSFWVLEEIIK